MFFFYNQELIHLIDFVVHEGSKYVLPGMQYYQSSNLDVRL
jgi:hypothetical protein